MPNVSVIIPAYNGQAYIRQAIESVLHQSYRDFEIIVVDDGSTDDTTVIVRSFADSVRFFSKKNGGPGSARNVGIRHSMGKYIAFLDQDDLWLPDPLAEQLPLFDKNPELGMVFADACHVSVETGFEQNSFSLEKPFAGMAFQHLFWGNFIPNLTVLVRKECFDRLGLLDESGAMLITDDYNMWLRVAAHYPIAYIDKPLARYRIHENNFSNDLERVLLDSIASLRDVLIRHPHLNAELGSSVQNRFAELYYKLGRHYLAGQNFSSARHAFCTAWELAPTRIKTNILLLYGGFFHLYILLVGHRTNHKVHGKPSLQS